MRQDLIRNGLLAGGVMMAAISPAAHAQIRSFDVPAQDAAKSIPEFSRQAGIQIIVAGDMLRNLRTPAVRGRKDARAALKELLATTNLVVASDRGNVIVLRIAGPQAVAQPPDYPEAADGNDIIVTATRRATRSQEAPINIAAIGGAQLEREGLKTLSEATRSVPGINIIDQGGRGGSRIVVRGLNADSPANNDNTNDGGGTVATYVGETPMFVELKLHDIERIEVLLGPQGTLYGAGTLGGAVRYVPARPKFGERLLQFRGDLYRYNAASKMSVDGGATVNLPLTDNLALRAVVDHVADSGFIDQNYVLRQPGVSLPNADFSDPDAVRANFRRVKDVNYEKTWSGRVAARYEPSDAIDLNLTYYFQFQDIGGRQASSHRLDHFPVRFGKYESALRVLEPAKRDNQLWALEGSFDLGFATLTSATGYSRYLSRATRDQTDLAIELGIDYEAFPAMVDITDDRLAEKRFNQEFRLVSDNDGPFSWTAGAFYNRFNRSLDYTERTPGLHDFFGIDTGGDDRDFLYLERSKRSEYAAYGEVSYKLAEPWTVTVGGRYYSYDLKFRTAAAVAPFPATGPEFELNAFGQKDSGFLGKINTSYRFSPDAMLYATVSQGYRSGNSNGLSPCPEPLEPGINVCGLPNELAYQPDTTTNYEIGLKSQWFDRRLTLNASIFYIDWKDIQLSSATAVGSSDIIVNGPGASSKGVEFNLDAQITPELRLRGSYAYTDAQLDARAPNLIRTIEPPGFLNVPPVYVDGEKGDRLPGSPRHRGSLSLDYTRSISDSVDLDLGWSVVASGNVLTTAGGRGDGLTLPGYAINYARIGLVDSEQNWSVTLYADNIFNKFAEVSARGTALYNQTVPDAFGDPVYNRRYSTGVMPPRRVGVRFTRTFR